MKKTSKESLIIARHISCFLNEYAPSQKTDSIHTLRAYQTALRLYLTFLETEKKVRCEELSGSCFQRSTIEEWLIWLKEERGCSPATCNNRLASLRTFLKYIGSRDQTYLYIYHEASEIPRRKCRKKKVAGLSRKAVKTLMECPDLSTKSGRRDISLMILLYGTAARLDEILSMRVEQLHLSGEKPYATIIGKGNKIRTLYLLPKSVAHLNKYIQEFHGVAACPNAYLFYSRNTGINGKLTQPAIDKMLKKYANQANHICPDVPIGLHAHQFRHAKASHWLEDGMNIVQISFLLGHEQLETTMVYLDITTEEKAKALATLEDDNDKKVSPKWKNNNGTLVDFCGLRT